MAVKANTKRKVSPSANPKTSKSPGRTKHVGDVLGLSGSVPPKPKKPLESAAAGGTRRGPKGIEIGTGRKRRPHLPPARVRG